MCTHRCVSRIPVVPSARSKETKKRSTQASRHIYLVSFSLIRKAPQRNIRSIPQSMLLLWRGRGWREIGGDLVLEQAMGGAGSRYASTMQVTGLQALSSNMGLLNHVQDFYLLLNFHIRMACCFCLLTTSSSRLFMLPSDGVSLQCALAERKGFCT